MRVRLAWALLLALALAPAVPARLTAQPMTGETLLVGVPPGYKVDFQSKQPHMLMTEMVPEGQSVKDWTEMLTTQIFYGERAPTAEAMQARMRDAWLGACKEGTVAPIAKGDEHGYPVTVWMSTCPRNSATGKPEHTWFKAIRGNDSLYVVQKAFRFEPSREQVVEWMQFLRRVAVCDSRRAERKCPAVGKQR